MSMATDQGGRRKASSPNPLPKQLRTYVEQVAEACPCVPAAKWRQIARSAYFYGNRRDADRAFGALSEAWIAIAENADDPKQLPKLGSLAETAANDYCARETSGDPGLGLDGRTVRAARTVRKQVRDGRPIGEAVSVVDATSHTGRDKLRAAAEAISPGPSVAQLHGVDAGADCGEWGERSVVSGRDRDAFWERCQTPLGYPLAGASYLWRLPKEDQDLLWQHYIHERDGIAKTTAEIAEHFGVSERTVRRRLAGARERLEAVHGTAPTAQECEAAEAAKAKTSASAARSASKAPKTSAARPPAHPAAAAKYAARLRDERGVNEAAVWSDLPELLDYKWPLADAGA